MENRNVCWSKNAKTLEEFDELNKQFANWERCKWCANIHKDVWLCANIAAQRAFEILFSKNK